MCVTVQAALYFPSTLMVPQFSHKVGRQSSEGGIALSLVEYPSFCQDPCYTFSFTLPSSALKVWTTIVVCLQVGGEPLFCSRGHPSVVCVSVPLVPLGLEECPLFRQRHTFHIQTSVTYK